MTGRHMADQEIAKHTKKIWATLTTSEHGIWPKLRDILLEIVIIVFAVSMSIWLHSVGEHRHEQKQVKTFLLGLKRDIQSDLNQINGIVEFHRASDARFAYLASLDPHEAPDRQKFNDAYTMLQTNSFLVSRLGRYEGFKSSGKLTNIENDALLEKITTLYDYDLPKLNMSSGGWRRLQGELLAYADEKLGEEDSPGARFKMIASSKGKRLSERMVTHHQLYERYQIVVDNGSAIIKDIDNAYPEQAKPAPAAPLTAATPR
jgi:hypothetical protein